MKMMKRLIGISLCLVFLLLAKSQYALAAQDEGSEGAAYTVTLDPNGGKVSATSLSAAYGKAYGKLPVPTRAHYKFEGWFLYASGGNKITEYSIVQNTAPHTLYAHWIGEEAKITLNPNGGKLNSTSAAVYYGSKYYNQLPTPTRENYNFDGWYTAKTGGDKITEFFVYETNSPKKLYARWSEKKFTVVLIAFNGEKYEAEVTCGKKYGKLPTPKKEGYKFQGWYTWEDYSNSEAKAITKNTKVTETSPRKLFARWYFSK